MSSDTSHIVKIRARLQSRSDNLRHQFTVGYKGTRVSADPSSQEVLTNCFQGEIFKTERKLNLAINGKGWFVLQGPTGRLYSRDGQFQFEEGRLTNRFGEVVLAYPLDEEGKVMEELSALKLTIDPNNKLYAGKYTDYQFDEAGFFYGVNRKSDPITGESVTTTKPLYQLALCTFENPERLARRGVTTFAQGDAGEAVICVPGVGTAGAVCPNSLESSNVQYYFEDMQIKMDKLAYKMAKEASVSLFGELSVETIRRLRQYEVTVEIDGKLHSLQGRDSESLHKGIAKVHSLAPDSEQPLLLKALKMAGPKIVFED